MRVLRAKAQLTGASIQNMLIRVPTIKNVQESNGISVYKYFIIYGSYVVHSLSFAKNTERIHFNTIYMFYMYITNLLVASTYYSSLYNFYEKNQSYQCDEVLYPPAFQ